MSCVSGGAESRFHFHRNTVETLKFTHYSAARFLWLLGKRRNKSEKYFIRCLTKILSDDGGKKFKFKSSYSISCIRSSCESLRGRHRQERKWNYSTTLAERG